MSATPRLVILDPSMLGGLMALSTSAHWNQTEADWQAMLGFGQGWGLQVQDGAGRPRLAASTVVLPYDQRFAWVSMVLVLPEWRRQGLAKTLLRVALDHLQQRGLEAVLDATPAGHPVYQAQGFEDCWRFTRWRLAERIASPPTAQAATGVSPLQQADWPAVVALDTQAFGANRLPLLQYLASRLPEAAWVLREGGVLRGYLLGRDGRTASQLGPLVVDAQQGAHTDHHAIALLAAALGALRQDAIQRPMLVDVRDGQPALQGWLTAQRFNPERSFTRMVHQPLRTQVGHEAGHGRQVSVSVLTRAQAPGDPSLVALVAGPELG
jgi:ribosomal protein S18 acetylase RimI-like enzyme